MLSGVPAMEFPAREERRGQYSMVLGQGHFLAGGGESWKQQKKHAQAESGRQACPGAAKGGLVSLTRPLSPEQPAIHNLALQTGGVCLQPVPKQREPQPGGSRHPHHHEPESYRSVASGGVRLVARGRSCVLTTVDGARAQHMEERPGGTGRPCSGTTCWSVRLEFTEEMGERGHSSESTRQRPPRRPW